MGFKPDFLVPNVALQLSEGGWNLNLILRVSNIALQLSEEDGV